jgi:myo-inositol-1(or 4)-monophosphatase
LQAADEKLLLADDSDIELLTKAASAAGRIAMRYFKQDPEVWMKSGSSPVSEADYAVDHYLRETLTSARTDYGWLSEETTDSAARLEIRRIFIVDPIDGTRGFLDGGPNWCISVAVVDHGVPVAGVLECPATGETFSAVAGGGAFLNGKAIGVRQAATEQRRYEVAGPKPMVDSLPQRWRDLSHRVAYIPSLAYRIALIAAGRLDATFVKPNAHDWDIAAALLILREAGGRLVEASGEPPQLARATTRHAALAAGSGELLDAMVPILRQYDQG